MHRVFEGINAWTAVVGIIATLSGCSTPTAPRLSCPASPSAYSILQAKNREFSDGYHAGELAQALRDRARAREAAAALFKSKNDPLLITAETTLISPTPTASMQAPTVTAGSAVPLNKVWLGF